MIWWKKLTLQNVPCLLINFFILFARKPTFHTETARWLGFFRTVWEEIVEQQYLSVVHLHHIMKLKLNLPCCLVSGKLNSAEKNIFWIQWITRIEILACWLSMAPIFVHFLRKSLRKKVVVVQWCLLLRT